MELKSFAEKMGCNLCTVECGANAWLMLSGCHAALVLGILGSSIQGSCRWQGCLRCLLLGTGINLSLGRAWHSSTGTANAGDGQGLCFVPISCLLSVCNS